MLRRGQLANLEAETIVDPLKKSSEDWIIFYMEESTETSVELGRLISEEIELGGPLHSAKALGGGQLPGENWMGISVAIEETNY